MEQTRSPLDDLSVAALMAMNPLVANAQLTANALFNTNELTAEPPAEESGGNREAGVNVPEGDHEAPKRGLLDRIDHWFWRLEQRAIEARLADATDIYDLEVRIREIERGRPWWSH